MSLAEFAPQLIGLGLILFAGWTWYTEQKKGDVSLSLPDSVKDLIPLMDTDKADVKRHKIDLLKKFVQSLDPKKDKDKIEYIVDNFGIDFLKESISDEK